MKVSSYLKYASAACILSLCSTAAAMAQDGYGRPYNWSGIYFGASAGGIGQSLDWTYDVTGHQVHDRGTDAILGLHAGYQHQFWGGFLVGAEVSFGRTFGSFAKATCPNPLLTCQSRMDDLLTVGGRLGYGFDRTLIYASGGYSQGNVFSQARTNATGAITEVSSLKQSGSYLGGGVEFALTRSFIVGIDYKRVALASEDHFVNFGAGPNRHISPDADVVTARFSYKFHDEPRYVPLK